MVKQRGDAFLLKVDTSGGGAYVTVAGLRSTGLSGKVAPVEVTSKGSGGFRELLDGAGIQSFTLSGAGVFDSGAAHEAVRALFLGRIVRSWLILRGDGSVLTAPCLVTQLDYAGNHDGEESFSLTLESAGAITFA